jgi:YfiR/HmsC-like
MRLRATSILRLSLVWLLAIGGGRAQEPRPNEYLYQLKAAFLLNFAKFVEWPPMAFANADSPLVLGVLGENPFGDILKGKAINNRLLKVEQFHSSAEATNCHILFIRASEKERLSAIIQSLGKACVLTVGDEIDGFTDKGMINFVLREKKIRFQINDAAAKNVGLKISSKLLSLASVPQ